MYTCQITPHAPAAILPHLAFEGATKKTRPQLHTGDLVYARVSAAPKHADVELECFNTSTGKSEGLGPLKGGMCWDINSEFARRIMRGKKGGIVVLDLLSERLQFELAVGRNGRVWVDGGDDVRVTLCVGRALVQVDEEELDEGKQRELAKKVLRGL
jgi:exosome complex component RRP40